MSRIQELPNSLDEEPLSQASQISQLPGLTPESLTQSVPFPLPAKPASQNGANGTTPAMPPAMDSVKSRSVDEVLEMMNRTPLFMTSLDETDGKGMAFPCLNLGLHVWADSTGQTDSLTRRG